MSMVKANNKIKLKDANDIGDDMVNAEYSVLGKV